jgi:hypothetical protein
MQNTKHIRASIEQVIDRKLNNIEKDRLRKHSFDLAITQVAMQYRDELGIDELLTNGEQDE